MGRLICSPKLNHFFLPSVPIVSGQPSLEGAVFLLVYSFSGKRCINAEHLSCYHSAQALSVALSYLHTRHSIYTLNEEGNALLTISEHHGNIILTSIIRL